MFKKSLALLVLAFLTFLGVGCCPMTRLNVTVELDPAMKQQLATSGRGTLEIDLVAVNSKEHERWQNYSMGKYWTSPFELKTASTVYEMKLDPTKSSATLSSKDPIWDKWFANTNSKDVMRLYVLAQLPGAYDDAPGDTDPRRQILPLGACRWASKDVKLMVQKTGIITVTAPKPEK